MKSFRANIEQYLNYLFVAYAFLLPLSRAGMIAIATLMILLSLFDIRLVQKLKSIWQNGTTRAIVIFILFNIISLVWVSSENLFKATSYISKYWYFLPSFIFFVSLKRERLQQVISAFIMGMFISEIISYGIFFELWEFKHGTPDNPSPFMHHIEYSIFLAFTALLLLNRIFNEGLWQSKLFYSFFFITILGNLFLTNGRAGQIAFMIGLILLGFMSFQNRVKAFVVSSILLVTIITTAYTVSDTFHDRVSIGKSDIISVIEHKNYCSSWGARLGFWVIAGDIFGDNPLLGVGVKDNMSEFHRLVDTKYPQMKCITYLPHFHNQYLQILTATGLIGLLVFLSIIYQIFKIRLKSRRYYNIKIIFLSLFLFGFVAEPLLHAQFSMLFFSLIIGILLAQSRFENEI
jgi:O-antigen ligase